MTERKERHSAQKSRQELLDDLYCAQDVAGLREQEIASLHGELQARQIELDRILGSRWWRWTVPLRRLSGFINGLRRRVRADAGAPPSAERPAAAARLPASTTWSRGQGPHLFVDVSELALRQGRTGVQRVTREIVRELLATPPSGYTVALAWARPGQPYRPARTLTDAARADMDAADPGVTLDIRPGDVFLGLDHAMDVVIERAPEFAAMRERGVGVYFVCNDTLPLSRPDCFPPDVQQVFKRWFETITTNADGIACISRSTELAVKRWLDALQVPRPAPLHLGHFCLGSDIGTGLPAGRLVGEPQAMIGRIAETTAVLVVGTMEPRKGHAQTLAAFERLWAKGMEVALVLVGVPGWMTEVTARRVRHHEEFGRRLFWFMAADDDVLSLLYTHCKVLLMPSEAEGFGLPLIEAARHGLPVLCRDLPVFREIAGAHASYFSGYDAASLANAVGAWMRLRQAGTAPASSGMRCPTWEESARELIDVVLGGRWSGSWAPGTCWWFSASDPRLELIGATREHGAVVARDDFGGEILRTWPVAVGKGCHVLGVECEWLSPESSIGVKMVAARTGTVLAEAVVANAGTASTRGLVEVAVRVDLDVADLVMRVAARPGTRVAIEGLGLRPANDMHSPASNDGGGVSALPAESVP